MDGRSKPWGEKMRGTKNYLEAISFLRRNNGKAGRGEIHRFVWSITGKDERKSGVLSETIITAMLRNKDVTIDGDFVVLVRKGKEVDDLVKMKMSFNLIFVEPDGKTYGGYLPFLNFDKALGSSVQFTNSNGKPVQSTMIERWYLNFDNSVFEGITIYLGE